MPLVSNFFKFATTQKKKYKFIVIKSYTMLTGIIQKYKEKKWL